MADKKDSELDQEYKPSGRPQSTMALSFASTLDSAFSLSPELDNLSQSIQTKQDAVSSQSRELEELEARIRETEERLKRSRASSPAAGAALHQQPRKPLPGQREDFQAPRAALSLQEEAGNGIRDPAGSGIGKSGGAPSATEDFAAAENSGSRPSSRKMYSRGRPEGPMSRGSGR
ncbi:MAG: hypothetical protein Q9227_002575 [Pyrenula ochraceoflavens]